MEVSSEVVCSSVEILRIGRVNVLIGKVAQNTQSTVDFFRHVWVILLTHLVETILIFGVCILLWILLACIMVRLCGARYLKWVQLEAPLDEIRLLI